MDTSIWSQSESVFSSQFSVFSQTAESTAVLSSRRPDELSLPWLVADGTGILAVLTNSPDRGDCNVAGDRSPTPLVAEPPDSTVSAWNTLRMLMACSTFQTFVRAIDPDELLIAQLREEARSRRGTDNDSESYFLRTRTHAPALGRFLARDPR